MRMILKPPRLPLPEDPIEQFLYTLAVIVDVATVSAVFSHFPKQSPRESLEQLYVVCFALLLQVAIVLVAKYEPPEADD